MTKRKAINVKQFTGAQRRKIRSITNGEPAEFPVVGRNNGPLAEPVPTYDSTEPEVVIKNQNNSFIVLGRDRPADVSSGYGGKGNTQCGTIDIVVGRMAGTKKGPQADNVVSPNFFTDAARINISQKTDVDTNFGLVGDMQSVERSAIGIKADAVRVIGREGVKIVTGKAKNIEGAGPDGERNSQYGTIESIAGIELIAGNDVEGDELQPIVKAYALADCLSALVDRIGELSDTVNEMAKSQTQMNLALATHTHQAGPISTTPPVDASIKIAIKECQRINNVHLNLYKQKLKTETGLSMTYLSPVAKKWFGSRWNKTN